MPAKQYDTPPALQIETNRSYTISIETDRGAIELEREAGAQFDPRVVAVLRELLEREPALLSQPQSASVFDSGALRIPSQPAGCDFGSAEERSGGKERHSECRCRGPRCA